MFDTGAKSGKLMMLGPLKNTENKIVYLQGSKLSRQGLKILL
jgi:hypothetical protein